MLLPSTARDCRLDLPRFQPNERYEAMSVQHLTQSICRAKKIRTEVCQSDVHHCQTGQPALP